MKKSVRAMRMERHHKRMAKESKLSLVSLMDIFTILVFFLMFNASDVQVLQSHKSVKLPTSSVENAAAETLVIMVNSSDLMLQGKKLADVERVMRSSDDIIKPLSTELKYQASREGALSAQLTTPTDVEPEDTARSITIMGDKDIPYKLLKKIMQTCAESGYTNISLAVEQLIAANTNNEVVGS
jgi:biopolymer transport protein ExbD